MILKIILSKDCIHFYLINIHVFDYADSQLSRLFTEVLTSLDNRGSTVLFSYRKNNNAFWVLVSGITFVFRLRSLGDTKFFNF